MMYRSGKGSPHSHGTPVDVVPTTVGIPSTLNPLSRYYREFQSHSRGNTADTATVSLFNVCVHHTASHSSIHIPEFATMRARIRLKLHIIALLPYNLTSRE